MAYTKPINSGYTVIQGVTSGDNSDAVETWLEWKETGYNVENNTSDVKVYLYSGVTGSSSTWSGSGGGKSWITINGTEYTIQTNSNYDFRNRGTYQSWGSKTLTGIPHNTDGTKSITIGARFTTKSSYVSGGTVSNRSVALTNIPRASTFTLSASSVAIGSSITVNITRAVSSFKHKVTFKLGSNTQTVENVGTSTTFTLPAAWYSQLPSSTSGTVTVTVQTFDGDTALGSRSATFTATVASSVKPAISSLAVAQTSDNTTVNGWNKFVQGISKAAITVSATAGTGSSIASYKYEVGSLTAVTSSNSSYTSPIINQTNAVAVKVTVTDTRGRTATSTQNITVNAYSKPSISMYGAFRSTANKVASQSGTYITAYMSYAYSDVGGSNTLSSYYISYKPTTSSTWTTGQNHPGNGVQYAFGGGNISPSVSYNVILSLTDALGNRAYKTAVVTSAEVPFNIKPNAKGIGIGKYAEDDETIDIAWKVKGVAEAGAWSYASGWEAYESGVDPVVKKWGPCVHLVGAVTPTAITQLPATPAVQIGSVPAAFAPSSQLRFLCQGSGTSFYCLTISTAGSVFISRNRDVGNNNSEYTDGQPGNWFPFSVSWII